MTSTFGEPLLDDRLRDALARDIAASARRVGIASMRASIVDLRSMAPDAGWALAPRTDAPDSTLGGAGADSTLGDVPDSELGLNTGFQAELADLAELGADEMLLRRQSPRRWAFGWRLDRRRAVVGAVLFSDRLERIDPETEAWLRVLANTGLRMRGGSAAGEATAPDGRHELTWPKIDRRAPQKLSRADVTLLAMLLLGVLLSALLLGYLLPRWQDAHEAQRAHIGQLAARGERTVAQRVCETLSRGDYGDVQTELSSLAALGYFTDAAVSNTRGRVVAMVGKPEGLSIGAALPADMAQQYRSVPLAMGAQDFGTLWLPPESETTNEVPLTAGLTAAALIGAVSLVSVLVVGRRLAQRRR